jgi:hypothetical protein
VAQVVECLLCQHKVLSLNPSPTKKKEKKEKKNNRLVAEEFKRWQRTASVWEDFLDQVFGFGFWFLVFGFFGGTGASTQGLTLARQVLYDLSHSASPSIKS